MNPESKTRATIQLNETSWLHVYQVFDEDASHAWMQHLLAEVAFEARAIRLFGKSVLQPRLVGWAGNAPYSYSGQTLAPRPMGEHLLTLLKLTQSLSGYRFNHALLNLYRNGADSMGMHSDDERELGKCPSIASWSFGASRRLTFAEKKGKFRQNIELSSGELLLMAGTTQHHFHHGVPKDARVQLPRLNVTFRLIYGADEAQAKDCSL